MEQRTYKYKCDRKTIIATTIYFVLFTAAAILLAWMYAGGYFSAWFVSLMVALVALMTLSIPRKITLDSELLVINCVLEVVEIPTKEIVSVRKVDYHESRWMVPIFGSRGFFGYFGYYLNLTTLERVRFYATERQNLIEIVDSYDDHYYISCREADDFIQQVEQYIMRIKV